MVGASRGAFDFETTSWTPKKTKPGECPTCSYDDCEGCVRVDPLCCGFMWGPPGERQEDFTVRESLKEAYNLPAACLIYMREHPTVTEWWAHNMGRFDGLFFCAAAGAMGWEIDGSVIDSRVIELVLTHPGTKKSVRLYDSVNLVPSHLRAIAKDFELPSRKLFQEEDYRKSMADMPRAKLRAGCLTDCALVLELLERLESQVETWGGTLKRTFSSTALGIVKATLKNKGMQLPNFQPKERRFINKVAGEAYLGGRVEVIHHAPQVPLVELDVCSSYPWSMAQPMPWEFVGVVKGKRLLDAYEGGNHLIVEATVNVPQCHLPPLPYLPHEDSGVFFPTGKWKAWFVADELRYAESVGVDVTLHQGHLYTTENPFSEFIHDVYKLKSNAAGAVRNFAKLILNGCYGKFGESPEKERLLFFNSQAEGIEYIMRTLGTVSYAWECDERALLKPIHYWPRHAHYAVAAHITARSRMLLHRRLLESVAPAYCDTDSVHAVGWEGETGTQLGAFKVELFDYLGEFLAPKIYRLTELGPCVRSACASLKVSKKLKERATWKKLHTKEGVHRPTIACKGFPVDAKSFEKLYGQKPVESVRTRLLKSQIKEGGAAVIRRRESRTWKGLSMKRRPLPDGSTVPWTVKELQAGVHESAECPLLDWKPESEYKGKAS